MSIRRFSPEVVAYMRNEAPATHPAFGSRIESSTRCQERASQATKEFLERVQAYSKASTHSLVRDASTVERATWPDVIKAMNDSQSADEAKADGWKGVFHWGGRKIGGAAASVEPWLGLLPGDLFGSVLCGGLKLVFNAAARKSEVREKVLQTLSNIPETLSEAQQFLEQYPYDEQLSEKMLELYITMLQAFRWILDFYHQSWRENFKVFWKQDAYVNDFDAIVDAVQTAAKSLRTRIDLCLHGTVGDIRHHLARLLEEQVTKQDLCDLMYDLRREYASNETLFRRTREQLELPVQSTELNNILQVRPDTSARDVLVYDSRRGTVDLDNAMVDQYIMQTSLFRTWISSRESLPLGILDIFVDQTISPLTTFCATLLSNLARYPFFLTLSYFCQPHTDDDLAGGSGLIRSLLAQLLPHVSLEGLSRSELLRSSRDPAYLVDLFVKMIDRLSGCVIFCVIDGIHAFDPSNVLAEEVKFVLAKLLPLASTPHPRLVFKLLVTGLGSSWFFKYGLSIHHQLMIEDDFRSNNEDCTEELMSGDLAW